MDLPTNLRTLAVSGTSGTITGVNGTSAVCAGGVNNARVQGTGGCGLNKELFSASFGTIWSPVSFVDVGVEYAYGHRLTQSNVRGDVNALVSRFTVRF